MDLLTFLKRAPALASGASAKQFSSHWTLKRVAKGAHVIRQGAHAAQEVILLDGCLTSCICDADGHEVCVGLYVGPCIVAPMIARTRDTASLVSIRATRDALIAQMDSATLTTLMLASEPVRDWANGVLRAELARKADREWCLAALSGAERLAWFRDAFPGYEEIFTHMLIASFLGMTPVTMSRLRNKITPSA